MSAGLNSLPIAILAGGLATRLRPITERIPKALVDVAGEPFIAHQLRHVRRQGIERVVMCVGHLGEQLQAVVGDGRAFGLHVDYAWDGPRALGTGGALRQALPLLGDAFFVVYGDSYLPIDFQAVAADFARRRPPALMTVLHNAGRWDRSNVRYADGRVALYDKSQPTPDMAHIDYGLAVLSAAAFDAAAPAGREPFDLAELYHALSVSGRLAGHQVRQRFYEIGSHEGLADTIAFLSRNLPRGVTA